MQSGNSLSPSPVPCFSPLSSLHLFLIMLSAISTDCALLLSVSASHFALTAVNRRSVEVGSPMNPSAEESRQRLMEKAQQTIKKVVHVCLRVSPYTMAIRRDSLHFTFVSRTPGLLSLINFL